MLQGSKVEFKGDHFMINDEQRVEILSKVNFDKMEKKNKYIEENNYVVLGNWVQPNNPADGFGLSYKFVTLGVSGTIYALPPEKIKVK